ncbi:MAG TPA: hypothetical protein VF054_18945 [Micromonosporaceae bacterium]
MPGFRDVLDRFRPAGTPGPPAGAGVPVDRAASAAVELEPVFAALAEADRAAQRYRDDAAARAEQRVRTAGTEAADLVAAARQDAPAQRAAAAAALLGAPDDPGTGGAADRVRTRASDEFAAILAEVVDRARAQIEAVAAESVDPEPIGPEPVDAEPVEPDGPTGDRRPR